MIRKILTKLHILDKSGLNSGRRSAFQLLLGLTSLQLLTSEQGKIANDDLVLKNGWIVKKSEVRE